MKVLLITALLVMGCTTTIDSDQFQSCLNVCKDHEGLHKAGRNPVTEAKCCECKNGKIIDIDPGRDVEIDYEGY